MRNTETTTRFEHGDVHAPADAVRERLLDEADALEDWANEIPDPHASAPAQDAYNRAAELRRRAEGGCAMRTDAMTMWMFLGHVNGHESAGKLAEHARAHGLRARTNAGQAVTVWGSTPELEGYARALGATQAPAGAEVAADYSGERTMDVVRIPVAGMVAAAVAFKHAGGGPLEVVHWTRAPRYALDNPTADPERVLWADERGDWGTAGYSYAHKVRSLAGEVNIGAGAGGPNSSIAIRAFIRPRSERVGGA